MPLGPLAIAGIQAVGQIAGAGINAAASGNLNRKTRKFVRENMNIERGWALEDWEKQNKYNSPLEQMARLKAAGLNPNLVYGNGTDVTVGPVRGSGSDSWNPQVPQWGDMLSGVSGGLAMYYDLQLKQAQIDNVKAQTDVTRIDAGLRAAQTLGAQVGAARGSFDLNLARDLRDISMESARESVRKLSAEADVLLRRDEREAVMNSANVAEAVERIATLRLGREKTADERREIQARIKSIEQEMQLRGIDLDWRKKGVTPSDPLIMRMLALGLQDIGKAGQKRGPMSEWFYRMDVEDMEKKAREFMERNARPRKK